MEKEQFDTVLIDDNDLFSESRNLNKSKKSKPQQDILAFVNHDERKSNRVNGAVIGKLVGIGDSGSPLVDFPLNRLGHSLTARSTISFSKEKVGREIVLIFEEDDPQKPIIMGFIHYPEEAFPINGEIDGEKLNFTAKKEIVLNCGKASITLTRAGKIIIRGTYLLNRSSGVNRIKGGSVQIN